MSANTGNVRRRDGNGSYYFILDLPPVDGKRKQLRRGGFKTKGDALEARDELLAKIRSKEYVEPSKLTIREFIEQTWLPIRAPLDGDDSRLRPSTYASYKNQLDVHVLPRLGGIPLQRLTAIDLNRMYAAMLAGEGRKRKLSPRSVRYVHAIVRAALAYAVEADLVARNVADKARPPKPSKRGPRGVWSIEELRRFLNHVRDRRLYAMWVLFVATGARRGEIVGLRWSDVDLDAGTLTIRQALVQAGDELVWGRPKSDNGLRTLTLDGFTVAALREHRKRQAEERLLVGSRWESGDLVFCWPDGSLIHPARVTKMFERLAKQAGLPRVRLHDLRHAWASHAIAAGVDASTVMGRLGHHSAAFTMQVYVHAVQEAEKSAAEKMGAALLG